ncbi:MAG: YdcF family protein [Magnetococcus sp. YQC-5]
MMLILIMGLLGLTLLWFTQRQKTGRVLVTMALVVLGLLSSSPVSRFLLEPLEKMYVPYAVTSRFQPLYVVVLSGGAKADPTLSSVGQINPETLVRLAEGIRIFREHPESKLLVSGGAPFAHVAEAEIMADVAKLLGVSEEAMVLEKHSLDTDDQARIIKKMIGAAPFVLVTSASHLPRSMVLFRKYGLDPVPAPAAQRIRTVPESTAPLLLGMFAPHHLSNVDAALHEYLGMLWARLRQ